MKHPRVNDADLWPALRSFTSARIGLESAGPAIGSRELLSARIEQARAKDAVMAELPCEAVVSSIAFLGHETIVLDSGAHDRETHLLRPDLGRTLAPSSYAALQRRRSTSVKDLALVISDGLSALAVQRQCPALLQQLLLRLADANFSLGPLVLLRRGRVAAGDQVARALGTRGVVVLIGERPGMSAIDSLGAYLTWNLDSPRTDADRNCISNIRPEGLSADMAARKIVYLLEQARCKGMSGVMLKDEQDRAVLDTPTPQLAPPGGVNYP